MYMLRTCAHEHDGQPSLPYGQPYFKVVGHLASCPEKLFLTLKSYPVDFICNLPDTLVNVRRVIIKTVSSSIVHMVRAEIVANPCHVALLISNKYWQGNSADSAYSCALELVFGLHNFVMDFHSLRTTVYHALIW